MLLFWMTGAILLIVCLLLYAVLSARAAEASYPPAGQFLNVEGVRLHYVRRGSGPSLVLLHGSEGFLQDYTLTVLDRLAEHYDVLVFDRPGHGYSGVPVGERSTPQAQARLLHEALRQLNISCPLLVGHSWSGLLLLLYALEYPGETAGLILLAPWAYPPVPSSGLLLRLAAVPFLSLLFHPFLMLIKGPLIGHYLSQAFSPAPVPESYRRLAEALWLRSPRGLAAVAQENTLDEETVLRLSQQVSQLSLPIVIVTGEKDAMVSPEENAYRLHREIPHSRLLRVPENGHELLHEAPDSILQAVAECAEQAREAEPGGEATRAACSLAEKAADAEEAKRFLRARELVMRYGWNATAYQILNPDIEHWFSADGEGCVGFVRWYGVWVVAGAPVCEEKRLLETAAEFEREAAKAGERVCYFGAAQRLRTTLQSLPTHTSILVGAQPSWQPAHWESILKKHRSLRAQLNRARNKGAAVTEWDTRRGASDRGLQQCYDEWRSTHAAFELHFLTEAVSLDSLADRRLFVAEGGETPLGFLIATPVPDRNGWLIEQIVRGNAAPNGTAELLIDGAMRTFAAEGFDYVTLGLAPLSRRASIGAAPALLWLRLLLAWVRAHGKRFYNFEGLDAFKAKFQPDEWEPIFAISNESKFSIRTLYGLTAAFTEGSPLSAIAGALVSAAQQEFVWLRQRKPTRTE